MNERRQELKANLDAKRLPCAVAIPESKFIENVGGIIRSANAFLIQEVILDSRSYNKAATVGCERWENLAVCDDVFEYVQQAGYQTVALEQHARSVALWDFVFPKRVAIFVGHEVQGMRDEDVERCDHVIEIPQYGLVESLNVATATSIVLYEYSKQLRQERRD